MNKIEIKEFWINYIKVGSNIDFNCWANFNNKNNSLNKT